MKTFTVLVIAILFSQFAIGQSDSISIQGKITDAENKQPLMFATVAIYKNGYEVLVTGTNTDLDGNYSVSNLDTGFYDIKVSYTGYKEKNIAKVEIFNDTTLVQNIELSEGVEKSDIIFSCPPPMIRHDRFTKGRVYTSEDLRNSPIKN